MENLLLKGSKYYPTVEFDIKGQFKMQGNAIPTHSLKFFDPIFEWVKQHRFEKVKFDINMYYFNTSVAKLLLNLFCLIREQLNSDDFIVNWFYEEGDEDIYDHGKYFQRMIPEADFRFFEYEEMPTK